MKGKKLFSFWVVWPQDKSGEPEEKIAEDSDEEEQREEGVGGTMGMKSKDELYKQKDLKHVRLIAIVAHYSIVAPNMFLLLWFSDCAQ